MDILKEVLGELGAVGTGFSLFIAINMLFFKADDFFSKAFKDDFALRLLCLEPNGKSLLWPESFVSLFDKVFKKSHCSPANWRNYVSWHTFFRSCAASLISLFLMIAIGVTVGPFSEGYPSVAMNNIWYSLVLLTIFFNFIPDYLSLLQTRYFMGLATVNPTKMKTFLLLLVDFCITGLFFLLSCAFVSWAIISLLIYFLEMPESIPSLTLYETFVLESIKVLLDYLTVVCPEWH